MLATYREKLLALHGWDEDLHPRDERGRFGDKGGGAGTESTEEHGEYFHTAADALHSLLNKETANVQPGDVRALLKQARELPPDTVEPDLTDLHVNGKLIFGGNGLGIPREKMPQIPKEMRADYVNELRAKGVTFTKESLDPRHISPTQREISARKAGEIIQKYDHDKHRPFPPILISKDGHVLDGHHHWAAMAALALDHPGIKIPVYRLNVTVKEGLKQMQAFDKKHKIESKAAGAHDVVDGRLDLGDNPFVARQAFLLGHRIDLPNIADVSFPTLIGAVDPAKPKKKRRRPYNYKGVHLSRRPMKFEVRVLSLTEIPPRLDLATQQLLDADTDAQLARTMQEIATYGSHEVLRELVRQGAPDRLLTEYPPLVVTNLCSTLAADRSLELSAARAQIVHKLSQRRLRGDRLQQWTEHLLARRTRPMSRRYAARAVNEAFAFGRTTVVDAFRRTRGFDLAKQYRDENGKFISVIDALAGGDVSVDAVVQTAIMDTNTCDECADVDGEVMDFGDDRQLELHPPYALCLGEDRCRCIQVALLDDGSEINVDEIDEDTLDEAGDF